MRKMIEQFIPPYAILLASIPCITPPIGHLAITDSRGIIHDFGGFINISPKVTIFGQPKKYYSFENALTVLEKEQWDENIINSEFLYKNKSYNLFTANCHHFVADVLNRQNISQTTIGVLSFYTKYRFHMRKIQAIQ